ncbi:Protein of unknown function [Pyronema omphalodes CBS 100304]|uniref:Uncharacterized protein n=1 Tax=Pyronema omphalodes (strain CBS 100304) TaxID=1076935 RepID=U4LBT3_PYROM|nr:Protein of unknown function [Pyronema omphalodes CBS 100304]
MESDQHSSTRPDDRHKLFNRFSNSGVYLGAPERDVYAWSKAYSLPPNALDNPRETIPRVEPDRALLLRAESIGSFNVNPSVGSQPLPHMNPTPENSQFDMNLNDSVTSSSESDDEDVNLVSDSAPDKEANELEYYNYRLQVNARISQIEAFDPKFYAQLGNVAYDLEYPGLFGNEAIVISDDELEEESNAVSDGEWEEDATTDSMGSDNKSEDDTAVVLPRSATELRSNRAEHSAPIHVPDTNAISRVHRGPTTNTPPKRQGTADASNSSDHTSASSSFPKVIQSRAINRVKQLHIRDGSPKQPTPPSSTKKGTNKMASPEKATSTPSTATKKTNQKTATPGKAPLPVNKSAEYPKRTRTACAAKDTPTEYDTDSETHDLKRRKAISGEKVSLTQRDLYSPVTRSLTRSLTSPMKEISKQPIVNSPAAQRPTGSSTMPKKIAAQTTPKAAQPKRKRAASEEKEASTQSSSHQMATPASTRSTRSAVVSKNTATQLGDHPLESGRHFTRASAMSTPKNSQDQIATPASARASAVSKNTPTQLGDHALESARHFTRASAVATSKEISAQEGQDTGVSTPLSRISNGEATSNDSAPATPTNQPKKTTKRSKRSRLGTTTKKQQKANKARHAAAALRAAENPPVTKKARSSIGYVYVSADDKKLTVEEMFAQTAELAEKAALKRAKELQASTESGDNLDAGKLAAGEQMTAEPYYEELDSELSEISADA